MSDKVRQQQQYQVLKQKYMGVGNEKTSPEEWLTNVHRDIYNSMINHSGLLEYVTLGKNSESKKDTKIELIRKMCETKIRSNEK